MYFKEIIDHSLTENSKSQSIKHIQNYSKDLIDIAREIRIEAGRGNISKLDKLSNNLYLIKKGIDSMIGEL